MYQNKAKTVAPRITHLVCSLLLLLTISLQLAARYDKSLPSLLVFAVAVLQKPCQGKFQRSGKSRFGSSERNCYFLKIPKWQHKPVREYKQRKLVSYFLNNAAKTFSYGLKNSENFQIKLFFSLKYFFISVTFSTQFASAPFCLKLFFISVTFST